MLYAIVSDIHANLVAWKAVLADLTAMKADKIVCLGDVVGYGPEPAEVLESVYRHVDAFVMGNHDAVAAGKMSAESFNEHARAMIEWTTGRISAKGRAFLGEQPLVLSGPGFVCTHGALDCPAAFNYILTPEEALATFNATDAPLVFVGHTHLPGIAVLGASGVPHLLAPQDFEVENGKRFIVNVGSVGDPRDEDPRASYCLYDDRARIVAFRRVAFDYATLKEAVTKVGIAPETVSLLRRDPVPRREPVRETLGFAPPRRRAGMARDVAKSADISTLRRTNHRLRNLLAAAIVAASALAGALAGMAVRQARVAAGTFVPAEPIPTIAAMALPDIWRNVLPPLPGGDGPLPERGVISGWRYALADPSAQRLSLVHDAETGRASLVIHNEQRLGFVLEAPEWEPNGWADDARLQIMLHARASDDFAGGASVLVVANRQKPGEKTLVNKELLLSRPGTFQQTKFTMPKKDSLRVTSAMKRIAFRVETEFSGTLTISDPQLIVVFDDSSPAKKNSK